MTQFDEAAQAAAKEIAGYTLPLNHYAKVYERDIAKHYAEIETVFGKLVELAVLVDGGDDVMEANMGRINAILNDRQVIEAMKGVGE